MNDDISILLVEDDEVELEALSRAIHKNDLSWNIVHAYDGREAMNVLDNKNQFNLSDPFIILLDLNMPGMNGFEFLEKIRAKESFKNIKIIVMSTSNHEQDRVNTKKYDIANYYVKSEKNEHYKELFRTIDSILHP